MLLRICLGGLALFLASALLVALTQVLLTFYLPLAVASVLFNAAGFMMTLGVCIAFGALLVKTWKTLDVWK